MSESPTGRPAEPAPRFDPSAGHHQYPKLRAIRGFPVPAQGPDGKQVVLLGLADARQISDRPPLVVPPAVQHVLHLLDGTRTIDQVVAQVGRGLTREAAEALVAQLDASGLLFGPVFDGMLGRMRTAFDASDFLPPGSTAAIADALAVQALGQDATDAVKLEVGPTKLREAMDQWIDASLKDAEDPAFDELPAAIVAPHVDYPRGWMNYGSAWGRMRVVDRPDRVVILGTNHFGSGTGVVGCNKGYRTPLGESPKDAGLEGALRARLGDVLFEHRYDHENEHSIELQLPWIQHCLGEGVAVFGALVHDPTVNNGESYDGTGVSLASFVGALRESLDELGGPTLVVASADLSHMGPAFGDSKPLAGDSDEAQRERERIVRHDREMLALVEKGAGEDLVSSMAWQANPTRWCSIGNLAATLAVVRPERVRLLNYAAAMDAQGFSLVSSAAMAMW